MTKLMKGGFYSLALFITYIVISTAIKKMWLLSISCLCTLIVIERWFAWRNFAHKTIKELEELLDD